MQQHVGLQQILGPGHFAFGDISAERHPGWEGKLQCGVLPGKMLTNASKVPLILAGPY